MKFYTAYNPSKVEGLSFEGQESLTQQCFAEDCDINNIMKRYDPIALSQYADANSARYEDVSSAPDFMESMRVVAEAQQMFDALPAKVRDRFSNSPASFLDFVHDESNLPEMIKLGLMKEGFEQKPVDHPQESAKDSGAAQ